MAPMRSAQNCDLTSAVSSERLISLIARASRVDRKRTERGKGAPLSLFVRSARLFDRLAQRAPAPACFVRAEQGHGEDERRQIIDRPEQQQRGEDRAAFGGHGLQHRGFEHAEPARRMARDAEHAGEGIKRAERHEGEAMSFRQEDVERAGGGADVDYAKRRLPERQQRPGQPDAKEDRLDAALADKSEIGGEQRQNAEPEYLVDGDVEMIDLADRRRLADEADADHQAHAEPEGDAGDEGETRHFPRREAGGSVNPVADRPGGDQREAQREGDCVAGEGGERGQPIGRLGAQMAQRQRIVAGQGEVAQAGQEEGAGDLVATGAGDRRPELPDVDPEKGAREEEERDGDDDQAGGDAEPMQQRLPAFEGGDEPFEPLRRGRGFSHPKRAFFRCSRHAPPDAGFLARRVYGGTGPDGQAGLGVADEAPLPLYFAASLPLAIAPRTASAAKAAEISAFQPASDRPRMRNWTSSQATTLACCNVFKRSAAFCGPAMTPVQPAGPGQKRHSTPA